VKSAAGNANFMPEMVQNVKATLRCGLPTKCRQRDAVAPMGKFDVGPSAAANRGPPNLPLPARRQADEFCHLGSLLAFPQFLITPPPVGVAEQARRQEMKWGVCVFFVKKWKMWVFFC